MATKTAAKPKKAKPEEKLRNNEFKERPETQKFEDEAKALLKEALGMKKMTHGALVQALQARGYPPIKEMAMTIRISRGGFSAAFLMQCLDAMGLELAIKPKR